MNMRRSRGGPGGRRGLEPITRPERLRAAIYCRVSSAQQTEGASLETQADECLAYMQCQGHELSPLVNDGQPFTEVYTGEELYDRPELTRVREAIRAGPLDVVVCHHMDRLSRDEEGLHVPALVVEAREYGCTYDFATGPRIDDSPVGAIVRAALAHAAGVEHAQIRKRSMRGRRRRASLGIPSPGRNVPYVWRWGDEMHTFYVVVPEQAEVVRLIFQLADDGWPIRRICRELDRRDITRVTGEHGWNTRTINRMLRRADYCGQGELWRSLTLKVERRDPRTYRVVRLPTVVERPTEQRFTLSAERVPPIVDPDLFARVQAILDRRAQGSIGQARKHPAEAALLRNDAQRTKVRCANCGGPMSLMWRVRGIGLVPSYQCTKYAGTPAHGCHGHSVHGPKTDWYVWTEVTAQLANSERLRALAEQTAAQAAREVGDDERERANLEMIERRLGDIVHERDGVQAALAHLSADNPIYPTLQHQVRGLDRESERLHADYAKLLPRLQSAEQRSTEVERLHGALIRAHDTLAEQARVLSWLADVTARYERGEVTPDDLRALAHEMLAALATQFALPAGEVRRWLEQAPAWETPGAVPRAGLNPRATFRVALDDAAAGHEGTDGGEVTITPAHFVGILAALAPSALKRQLLADLGVRVWVYPPSAGREVSKRVVFELHPGTHTQWGLPVSVPVSVAAPSALAAPGGYHMASPARTGTDRVFSSGASGQIQVARKTHEGL